LANTELSKGLALSAGILALEYVLSILFFSIAQRLSKTVATHKNARRKLSTAKVGNFWVLVGEEYAG
jgi:hypothetical protein